MYKTSTILNQSLKIIKNAFQKNHKNKTNSLSLNKDTSKDNFYLLNGILDESLYTVKEAAEILRCKHNTIYAWCYQKRLKCTKSGRKSLFRGKDLKIFLKIDDSKKVLESNNTLIYDKSTDINNTRKDKPHGYNKKK